jgi:hypothetical protein
MKKKYLFISIIVVFVNSCIIPQERPKFPSRYENNAEFDIICHLYFAPYYGHAYPDTTIFFDKPSGIIKKGSYNVVYTALPMEDYINDMPQDTLSIYYFHVDTVQKYTWEQIKYNYKILQRYDLSLDDIYALKENNIPVIPYPPSEKMKNMKMYPPYE